MLLYLIFIIIVIGTTSLEPNLPCTPHVPFHHLPIDLLTVCVSEAIGSGRRRVSSFFFALTMFVFMLFLLPACA